MRRARPGAIGAVLQRVVGWRVHLAATLIATLAVTGCSGSRASEESASSSTTIPVAPGGPVDGQPGPFRIGPAPAYAAIATTDTTVYEAPHGNAAITSVFPVKLPSGHTPLQQVALLCHRQAPPPSDLGRVRGVGPRDLGLLRRAGPVRHRRRPDRVTRHYRPARPRSLLNGRGSADPV